MTSKRSLGVFVLAMINVAAIFNIKNLPLSATYGFASVFYFTLAALFFFIPVALVSAELATGWPKRGGVYVWVKEALGHKWGFLAIWLQWAENVIWYPTILSFISSTIAFSINPALAENSLYTFVVVFGSFWGATWINLQGMRASGILSTLGVVCGTIIPGIIIIGLGLHWYFSGQEMQIVLNMQSFIPKWTGPHQLALLAGVTLGLAGMEMSAVHARDVQNPQKNFPRAILLSTLIILFLSLLGTLAIAIVIPKENINLVSGSMDTIAYFLRQYNLGWSVPVISILVAIGSLGAMSTWAAGPSKGLLAAAQHGDLPPVLHKVNKHDMPIAMLVFQGIIVSILSLLFLYMPDISSTFWLLFDLTAELYLLMYVLLFVSAIVLRYKKKDVHRSYRVPGGNFGMWLIAGTGLVATIFCMVVGFFPTDHLEGGTSATFFISFLAIGMIVVSAAPFVISCFKKPSWDEYVPPEHD